MPTGRDGMGVVGMLSLEGPQVKYGRLPGLYYTGENPELKMNLRWQRTSTFRPLLLHILVVHHRSSHEDTPTYRRQQFLKFSRDSLNLKKTVLKKYIIV